MNRQVSEMSRNRKKSKAVPVVLIITVLFAALAVAGFLFKSVVTDPMRKDAEAERDQLEVAIATRNAERQQAFEELQRATPAPAVTPAPDEQTKVWPEHKSEGWDILDLSGYPLENPTAETKTRAEIMNNGMLLVNPWHSRPDDFDESNIKSVGKYLGGNNKVQVKDYNVLLFPIASDALMEAINAARAEGLEHYIVEEGYRSWDEQNNMFTKKVNQLSSKYQGDALIEAAKKEVNYPGTSEYNTGLSFSLRLYSKDDAEVNVPKYSTTDQGKWMNENCWKYGLIFRFPQAEWPLATSQDKSFKTGVSLKLNLYRYVGKGNAAVMHYLDLCLEEYIEYLQEHPHIALFEDGVLKYEIYRQYIGDADTFNIQLTRNARSYISSLDNMGAVITVFEYQQ